MREKCESWADVFTIVYNKNDKCSVMVSNFFACNMSTYKYIASLPVYTQLYVYILFV